MKKNYLFRAMPIDIDEIEDNGSDLMAEAPDDTKYSAVQHIQVGSTKKTSFLSCSRSVLPSAIKYKFGNRRDKKTNELSPRKYSQVILVDEEAARQSGATVYDFSTDESWKELFRQGIVDEEETWTHNNRGTKMRDRSYGYAKADKEVLIKRSIPKGTYRVVPPILHDIMSVMALGGSKIQGDYAIQAICQMIMEDGGKEIMDAIDQMPLTPLQQEIMQRYYIDRDNMHQIAKDFEPAITFDESDGKQCGLRFAEPYPAYAVVNLLRMNLLYEVMNNESVQKPILERTRAVMQEEGLDVSHFDETFPENYRKMMKAHRGLPEGRVSTTLRDWRELAPKEYLFNNMVIVNGENQPIFGNDVTVQERPNLQYMLLGSYDITKVDPERVSRSKIELSKRSGCALVSIPAIVKKVQISLQQLGDAVRNHQKKDRSD